MITGNSSGNIHNRGFYCKKDNIIYFSNDHDGEGLYSHDLSTDKLRHLTNFSVDNINTDSEWVYFRGPNWRIFKIKPNNSAFESLTLYPVREILLIGKYLYHTSDKDLIRIDTTNDRREFIRSGNRMNSLTEYKGKLLFAEEEYSMVFQLDTETLEVSDFHDAGHFFEIFNERIYYGKDDNIVSETIGGTDIVIHYEGYEGANPFTINRTDKFLYFSICDRETDNSGNTKYLKWERVIYKLPFNDGKATLFINKENAYGLNVVNNKIYYIHGWAFHVISEEGNGDRITQPLFYRRPKSAEKVCESLLDEVINKPNNVIDKIIERTRQYYMLDGKHKIEQFTVGICHHPSVRLYETHGFRRHDGPLNCCAFELAESSTVALEAHRFLVELGMMKGEIIEPHGKFVYCFIMSKKKQHN